MNKNKQEISNEIKPIFSLSTIIVLVLLIISFLDIIQCQEEIHNIKQSISEINYSIDIINETIDSINENIDSINKRLDVIEEYYNDNESKK